MSYKIDAWSYLLAYGGAIPLDDRPKPSPKYVESYSSSLNVSGALTKKMFAAINAHGIDWGKTTEPSDEQFPTWPGTFADYDTHLTALTGTLYLNNGKSFTVGVSVPEDLGFGGAIRLLSEHLSLIDALVKLDERITEYDRGFGLPTSL